MEVGFSSADERSSIAIVNAIVHAYLDEVVNLERRRRFQRLDSLELVHANSEEQLRSKQNELKLLASALGTGDSESLTIAQQVAMQQLGYLQQRVSWSLLKRQRPVLFQAKRQCKTDLRQNMFFLSKLYPTRQRFQRS